MNEKENLKVLGLTFLLVGLIFLAIGFMNQETIFWITGPSFFTLGLIYLSKAKRKSNREMKK